MSNFRGHFPSDVDRVPGFKVFEVVLSSAFDLVMFALDLSNDYTFEDEGVVLTTVSGLVRAVSGTSLKTLYLSSVALDVRDLLKLLPSTRASLRIIEFKDFRLTGYQDEWTGVLRVIRKMPDLVRLNMYRGIYQADRMAQFRVDDGEDPLSPSGCGSLFVEHSHNVRKMLDAILEHGFLLHDEF